LLIGLLQNGSVKTVINNCHADIPDQAKSFLHHKKYTVKRSSKIINSLLIELIEKDKQFN